MKSALIIGANSTIGSALKIALIQKNISCTATSRRGNGDIPLDLAGSWKPLPKADVAYICAAITKLDVCENDPAHSRLTNVTGTQKLIEELQADGAHVIFLSSNQVFDGSIPYRKATDATSPNNEYGKQKAEVERWLLARPYPASVIRLTKVSSGELPILVKWKESLLRGERIEAFDDLVFAPVELEKVIAALITIGEKKRAGITQLSGAHDISYYALARELARKLGVSEDLVSPVSAQSKGILPQFLPKHGTLEPTII